MLIICSRKRQKGRPWPAYASLTPRYVFVKASVNLIRILCGPPSGSLASTSRISPNRIRKMDVGRAPAGASRRRNRTARMRSSPSLNDFSVVLIVVSICFLRSSIVIQRFTRFSLLKPCFLARSRSTYLVSQLHSRWQELAVPCAYADSASDRACFPWLSHGRVGRLSSTCPGSCSS